MALFSAPRALVVPAIQGRMGTTDFFQCVISARDIAQSAVTASEMPEWDHDSIFSQIQREPNLTRVLNEMVPYLLGTPDRFFGALILLVMGDDGFDFEPLNPEFVDSSRVSYRSAYRNMGTLTISSAKIVALDGQHRLLTLREVLQSNPLENDERAESVMADSVSVTFIRFESLTKTRRIFSKVNSQAKPTTAMDNIKTSEDDGYAILTRWLLEPGGPESDLPESPIASWVRAGAPPFGLIEVERPTVLRRDPFLYSLKAIYESAKAILNLHGIHGFDESKRIVRPSDEELRGAYSLCCSAWYELKVSSPDLTEASRRPARVPVLRDSGLQSMLLTQAGLLTCIDSAKRNVARVGIRPEEAIQRAARLSWRRTDDVWRELLVNGNGTMISKSANNALAARLQALRAMPDAWSAEERAQLQAEIRSMRGEETWRLDRNLI